MNNVQPQIPTLSIFPSRSGHRLSTARCASPRQADSTLLRQGFHSSHPGRFATNHKTSPLPQEDTEKATRLLSSRSSPKTFHANPMLVKFLYHQSGSSSVCHHTSPVLPARAVCERDTADLRLLTQSPLSST